VPQGFVVARPGLEQSLSGDKEQDRRRCWASWSVYWFQHNVSDDITGAREKTTMTDPAFSLMSLHTHWENYQQRLIATIMPLSSEQLALARTGA
jgi:hypothetical protein